MTLVFPLLIPVVTLLATGKHLATSSLYAVAIGH